MLEWFILPQTMAVVGLLANLAGVILLFTFGMPFAVRTTGGGALLTIDPTPETIAEQKQFKFWGDVGLILIIVATALQMAAVITA